MTRHRLGIAMAVALALASGLSAQNLEVELQRAIQRHNVTRDHGAAIEAYRRIADQADSSGSVAVAVEARLKLAETYRDSGNAKAREVYEEIVARYPAHAKTATAMARLNETARPVATMLPAAPPPARPAPRPAMVPIGREDDADSSAYITPDGHLLSRTDWETGDIVIRDLRTGQGRRLLDKQTWNDHWAEVPMVSPDGTQVLYTWFNMQDPGPGYQLRVMSTLADASPRQLLSTSEFTYFWPIGWSPEGRRALVLGTTRDDAQLLWVDTIDGTWALLKSLGQSDGTGRYSLSPDGRHVAYARLAKPKERNAQGRWVTTAPDQHIYVLPTYGPGQEVAVVAGDNVNESPVWTPDGKHLLFVSNRGAGGRFGLWSVAVEDGWRAGSERYVELGPAGRTRPIGMTQAGTLYYVPERPATPGVDVFVVDLETPGGLATGPPSRLLDTNLDSNLSPAWSPDGQNVAFVRARPDATDNSDRFEVVVYSLTTMRERTSFMSYLTNTPPVWLRDGSAVLVHRNYNNGQLLLWNPETDGQPRSIEAIAHATLPTGWRAAALSPDDRVLYLLVPGRDGERRVVDQRVVAFDLETGEERIIWTLPGEPGSGRVQLAVSPDGQSLAAALRLSDWTHHRLLLIPTDGSSHRNLMAAVLPWSVVWAPDGRSILVVRADEEGDLARVSVDDGRAMPVGLRVEGNTFDLSPDGLRLVFTHRTRDPIALMAYENILALLK